MEAGIKESKYACQEMPEMPQIACQPSGVKKDTENKLLLEPQKESTLPTT